MEKFIAHVSVVIVKLSRLLLNKPADFNFIKRVEAVYQACWHYHGKTIYAVAMVTSYVSGGVILRDVGLVC